VVVDEGKVTRVLDTPQGRAVETTLRASADRAGAPLFDMNGRVAAVVALDAKGETVHLVPPAELVGDAHTRSVARPAATPETAAAKPPSGKPGEETARAGAATTSAPRNPFLSADPKDVQRKLEKAYSKPSVPDDL
jgi:hypothetical protein